MEKYTLLNNADIVAYREKGEIVIEPYNERQLGNTSYDITLGPWYYREQDPIEPACVHNTFSKKSTDKYWGTAQKAKPASYYKEHGYHMRSGYKCDPDLTNIRDDDLLIFLEPGDCILAHTNEFIGGRTCVTTMLKCRSSVGRNNITICSCSGWGDINYYSRYTLEIRNLSHKHTTFVRSGSRVGQIVFLSCNPVTKDTLYSKKGKYQTEDDLKQMMENWEPSMMLPKMYLDYENFE